MGGLSSIPSRERIRSTLLGSIHTVGSGEGYPSVSPAGRHVEGIGGSGL